MRSPHSLRRHSRPNKDFSERFLRTGAKPKRKARSILQDTPEISLNSIGSRRAIGRPSDSDTVTEAGENDKSLGNREPHGKDQIPTSNRKAHRYAETLRRQFREVVNTLTRHDHAPKPIRRRRRTEETTGGFILAAKQIMRRSVGVPDAAFAAIAFLSETLDWLNPWHNEAISFSELGDDFHATEQQHIYPHL